MATLLAWPYPWDRVRQALNQPQGNWVCPKVLRQGQLREPSRTPMKPHIIPVLGLTRSCLGGFSSIPISRLGLFGGVVNIIPWIIRPFSLTIGSSLYQENI